MSVKLYEWFDVRNKEHLKAYKEMQETGIWPKGFLPEDIEHDILDQRLIKFDLADAYLEDQLK